MAAAAVPGTARSIPCGQGPSSPATPDALVPSAWDWCGTAAGSMSDSAQHPASLLPLHLTGPSCVSRRPAHLPVGGPSPGPCCAFCAWAHVWTSVCCVFPSPLRLVLLSVLVSTLPSLRGHFQYTQALRHGRASERLSTAHREERIVTI